MQASPLFLSDAIDLFVVAGFTVTVPADRTTNGELLVSRAGTNTLVQVKERQKTIYAWDAKHLVEKAATPLLVVVPIASRGLIEVAKQNSTLNVASVGDKRLVWHGEEILAPDTAATPTSSMPVPGRRRNPWGRWAVMRTYLLHGEPRSQIELARDTGVTQSAVSKANSVLSDLVSRSTDGWQAKDRTGLWERFMAEYSGPGGFSTYWYALDAVIEQSSVVAAAGADAGIEVLASGDSAADALAPWRIPTRAVVYARSSIALEKLGFAQTSRERATLQFTVPADHTIWATAASWARRTGSATADPVIAAWDVARTGGPDAVDAVGHLRDFVIAGDTSR